MTETRIQCPRELNQETGRQLFDDVHAKKISGSLVLDLSGTESLDSLGAAWLVALADLARARNAGFECEGQQGQVADYIGLIGPGLNSEAEPPAESPGVLEQVGDTSLSIVGEVKEFYHFLVDAVYWTALAPLEGRGFRWNSFIDEINEMGARALRITFLMNFLLGLIIAMLSAVQLEQFGASIYVADLVMIAFARELAAIMTAVVVSARTGAAIAAELATMKVQEEIDALKGMGLNVSQFLVAPKVLALALVLPILTGLGMIAGVLGGSVWGLVVLGFQSDVWLNQTMMAADMGDIFQGLFKAVIFAIIIALVGCHNGLRVTGGARGVGLMTTRAVVMDIFFIVFVDMIFAAIFYYVL